jgi:glycosyltransferase involved in cell wall biosynthesis
MTNRTRVAFPLLCRRTATHKDLSHWQWQFSKVLQEENRTFEIVFVNDGSPDGTWDTILRINASNEFLPLLYEQFDMTPSARSAFFRLNEDLLPTIRSRTKMLPKLREFRRPVRIIFGDARSVLE